jgi:uncharacterized protein (TIGR02266 family)
MPIEEKRRSSRLHLPIEIEALSGTFRIGTLKNISEEGMFIQSTDPKEVGTRLDLSLVLPGGDKKIRFVAEVAWVNPPLEQIDPSLPSRNKPVTYNPGMGVRILSIPPEDRDLFFQFVKDSIAGTQDRQADS